MLDFKTWDTDIWITLPLTMLPKLNVIFRHIFKLNRSIINNAASWILIIKVSNKNKDL